MGVDSPSLKIPVYVCLSVSIINFTLVVIFSLIICKLLLDVIKRLSTEHRPSKTHIQVPCNKVHVKTPETPLYSEIDEESNIGNQVKPRGQGVTGERGSPHHRLQLPGPERLNDDDLDFIVKLPESHDKTVYSYVNPAQLAEPHDSSVSLPTDIDLQRGEYIEARGHNNLSRWSKPNKQNLQTTVSSNVCKSTNLDFNVPVKEGRLQVPVSVDRPLPKFYLELCP